MKLDLDEALRYLGAGAGAPEDLRTQAAQAAGELEAALTPKYTYRVLELQRRENSFSMPQAGLALTGHTAGVMLAQCNRAVLLACTLGAGFDAMLRREQARDMARAVILDACGSALVEAGCDAAERELAERLPGLYLTDRFSPGYGDLPLELQPLICAALDTRRRLGLHVTDSLLLNPAKSVTAILGVSDRPQMARVRGCAHCSMRESCAIRKGGKRCGV